MLAGLGLSFFMLKLISRKSLKQRKCQPLLEQSGILSLHWQISVVVVSGISQYTNKLLMTDILLLPEVKGYEATGSHLDSECKSLIIDVQLI